MVLEKQTQACVGLYQTDLPGARLAGFVSVQKGRMFEGGG
jgi:hypothetical protein